MITGTEYDTHRATLVSLGNTLQDAEGDLERFFTDDDLDAGQGLLSSLRDVADTLGSLIADVDVGITTAGNVVDERAGE